MGSKVIGFRVPDDLAEEFKHACEERGQTTGEVLRQLVDDMLYPNREEAALSTDESVLGRLDVLEGGYEVLEKKLKDFDKRLEPVQVNRGLTEAEKEQLDELVSKMGLLTQRIDKIVEQENSNTRMVNENFLEWGNKVHLLFQALDKHTHGKLTGGATMGDEADKLIDAEVREADKHRGELPKSEEPNIIEGKTDKPGYKYLEHLNLSVKE